LPLYDPYLCQERRWQQREEAEDDVTNYEAGRQKTTVAARLRGTIGWWMLGGGVAYMLFAAAAGAFIR
jgi:hypothetical protein